MDAKMSRTAEEEQLLEERLLAMKKKNEELRRRHREVEADKQNAAKQNALVKMSVPHDDDWIPGRHDTHREDNHPNDDASQHRPVLSSQKFSGRRNDNQGNRQQSGDRFFGHDNRAEHWSGSGRPHDGAGVRSREWAPRPNRGFRSNPHPSSGDNSWNETSTFPSKVFKNSSMGPDRGKRPSYRLAEGDGPPPDPSYSFLTDSMRDSHPQESTERRRGYTNRRGFPRARGRGGQSWNNRGYTDSRNDGEERGETHSRPSEDAWRRERTLIDQERINRQKTSDGNWSREWDSNKVLQDSNDKPNRWRRGNQTQNSDRGFSQRGYYNNRNQRQNFITQKNDSESTDDAVGKQEQDQTFSKNKFIRRGRFSSQNKFKDNPRFYNATAQQSSSCAVEDTRELEDAAAAPDSSINTVENLQVSFVCDPSGGERRSVEGAGGNLRVSVSTDGEHNESKVIEQRRPRKTLKAKRSRALSSTSTGTTGTAEEDDGSWEDVSSDDDVSVVTELQKISRQEIALGKSTDVSSGPESLDPIPAPGKEDEFLWDDFHPAGFQNNVSVDINAAAAFKALLDEKAKEVDGEADTSQTPKVSFRLDTSCLEDSGDEGNGSKLDPLLVTTQIVQAEVDCMSLTSIPTDTSLPEDISQFGKTKIIKDENIPEEDIVAAPSNNVSAEELSGPISILDVSASKPLEEERNSQEPAEVLSFAKVEGELDVNNPGDETKGSEEDNLHTNIQLPDKTKTEQLDCKVEADIQRVQADVVKTVMIENSTSASSETVGGDSPAYEESKDVAVSTSSNDDEKVPAGKNAVAGELHEPLACAASEDTVLLIKDQVESGGNAKQSHEVSETLSSPNKAMVKLGEDVKQSFEVSEKTSPKHQNIAEDLKQSAPMTEPKEEDISTEISSNSS